MSQALKGKICTVVAGVMALLPLAAAGSGCCSASGDNGSKVCADKQQPDGVNAGNMLLTSFQKRDYSMFCKSVPEELAAGVSQKDFDRSVEDISSQFGELTDFSYLISLDTPGFNNMIWKTAFVRPSASGKRQIRQDLLFRVIAGNNGDGMQIISFGFL